MSYYRKLPVIVEAWWYTPDNKEAVQTFLYRMCASWDLLEDGTIVIETLEGLMRLEPNDWIVAGVHGEVYPVKPDVFRKTYEPVTEDMINNDANGSPARRN